MTLLQRKVQSFDEAFQAMKDASKELDALVKGLMKGADTQDLMALMEELPKAYRGTHRVYQTLRENETRGNP